MFGNHKISAVVPCYNEEAGIAAVIKGMPDFVDEVIIVDNGSTDGTAEIAARLGANVVKEPRKGYGRAYKTGFREARGDIVVTMDGDATYPTHAIRYLINIFIDDQLDFLSTRRIPIEISKSFNNVQRFFGNLFLTAVVWLLFQRNIRDSQSGMWIFWRDILADLRLTQDGMAFSEELKIEAFCNPHIRAREVPIQFKHMERMGASKLHLWQDGMKNLLFLFKKRFFNGTLKRKNETL